MPVSRRALCKVHSTGNTPVPNAALAAGVGGPVPGVTINRYRGSDLTATSNRRSLGRRRPKAAGLLTLSVLIWLLPGGLLASEVLEQKFEGIVVPRQWVQISPQVSGVISRILVAPGQRVAQGDVLFELDSDAFAIDVRIAQSQLAEERARLSLAEDAARRQAELLKRDATPAARAQQAEFEVEIARAVVARKGSALASAQLTLSRARVLAPISGTVGPLHVAPGAFVEAKAGTVLAEIAQLDPVLVSYYVPYVDRQRAFDKARTISVRELFQKATLSLELPSGRSYGLPGVPEYESVGIDPATDKLTVWAEFPNPDNVLVPGLKVRVMSHVAE